MIGAAANADEAREMIVDMRPDVVTLDIENARVRTVLISKRS